MIWLVTHRWAMICNFLIKTEKYHPLPNVKQASGISLETLPVWFAGWLISSCTSIQFNSNPLIVMHGRPSVTTNPRCYLISLQGIEKEIPKISGFEVLTIPGSPPLQKDANNSEIVFHLLAWYITFSIDWRDRDGLFCPEI